MFVVFVVFGVQICWRNFDLVLHLPRTLTSELFFFCEFSWLNHWQSTASFLWWRQLLVIRKRFQEPQQLMDTFTDLEELNLFLIQSSQADAHEATSWEGWWCRVHKFGWVFTHMIRWDAIVGEIKQCKCTGSLWDFPPK